MTKFVCLLFVLSIFSVVAGAQDNTFEKDIIKTNDGELTITFIGHGTLMFEFNDMVIHIDPVGMVTDYSTMPKADLIFVTHHHGDHLDKDVIEQLKKENTQIVLNKASYDGLGEGTVMKNGDTKEFAGIKVEAVPAYNTTEGRDRFHPKDRDNGYIFDFDGLRVYVAGDTEYTEEMNMLKDIDIAFLPMNQPYTMTPAQAAAAAKTFKPKVLYPYHIGNTDTDELLKLMEDCKDVEVRIRKM